MRWVPCRGRNLAARRAANCSAPSAQRGSRRSAAPSPRRRLASRNQADRPALRDLPGGAGVSRGHLRVAYEDVLLADGVVAPPGDGHHALAGGQPRNDTGPLALSDLYGVLVDLQIWVLLDDLLAHVHVRIQALGALTHHLH